MEKASAVKLKNRQGFTVAEMVIVVAVLAILVSISTPALYQFIQQREKISEENTLQEVRKAMQSYLGDKNSLPSDVATDNPGGLEWSELLAGYTSLSADQIANDTWGEPRAYIRHIDTSRNLQGTQITIYYATIHSGGVNHKAESNTGVAATSDLYDSATATDWWKNQADPVTSFSTVKPGGDDVLLRFTDYPEKLERYNLTIQRLDRISQALESFGKSRYAEHVTYCAGLPKDPTTGRTLNAAGTADEANCNDGMPEKIIYYPKSLAITNATDTATYKINTVYVDNTQSATSRRTAMEGLMRLLGMPDDFCCSALELADDDLPNPFYYFSNPRPRASGGGCGTRPDATTAKLPVRLTTKNDDTAASSPTCG